jgi:hypothetical protein
MISTVLGGGTGGKIILDGNVGIGVTSPLAKLHVKGSGTSGQVTSSFILENASSGTGGMDITGSAGASRWRFLYGGGPSTGTNALTESMCIITEGATAGSVGIGINSSIAKLTVINTADVNKQIVFSDNATYYGSVSHNAGTGSNEYRTEANGLHRFFQGTSATADMILNASGNLLLGTTASNYRLNVKGGGTVGDSSVYAQFTTLDTGTTATDGLLIGLGVGSSPAAYVGQYENAPLIFLTNGVEKMRVDSNGTVGIGETSPQTKLHMTDGTFRIDGVVANAIYIRGAATVKPYITINEYGVRSWNVGAGVYSAGSFSIQSNDVNGVYLGGTATAWASASDERLKDIIEPITDALTKVNGLRSVIGKYKTDEEGVRRSFLIAQDIQTHFPEALESSDPDKLGVQYTDVIPLLVAAIKEQQALIESMATKLKDAGVAGF